MIWAGVIYTGPKLKTRPELGTISRKTSDSTDKCNGQNLLILPLRMHSNFYEVRISKIDPVVTRAPPGMQNMSKNMAKMST